MLKELIKEDDEYYWLVYEKQKREREKDQGNMAWH